MLTVKEIEFIGNEIGGIVADLVAKAEAKSATRIAELEARLEASVAALEKALGEVPATVLAEIPVPKDGKDAEPASDEQIAKAVEAYFQANPVPIPKDGTDGRDAEPVTSEQIAKAVAEHLEANPIPVPQDGTDGKDGIDGKSVSVEDVLPILQAELQKAIEAIPVPRDGVDGKDGADGQSVTAEAVLPELRAELQKAIDAIPVPKDGRDGVDGKDGASVTVEDVEPLLKSMQATWALDFERYANGRLEKAVENFPKPKDGQDGKDGRDAMSLEDVQLSLSEDCRTLTVAFSNGEQRIERSVNFPAMIYQGVWKQGDEATPGDVKTYDGSMWVCVKATKSKPGEFNSDWKLAVKRGRNGKS